MIDGMKDLLWNFLFHIFKSQRQRTPNLYYIIIHYTV